MQQSSRQRLVKHVRLLLPVFFPTSFVFAIAVLSTSFAEDSPMRDDAFHRIVMIKPEQSVRQNIEDVAFQAKMPFCVEGSSDINLLLDKRSPLDTNRIDVAAFITSMETLGFRIQKYTNGVLFRTPEVVQIAENPLNHSVQEFHFAGQHEALVQKICSLLPGLPPNVATIKGVTSSEIVCRIDVTNSISVRDLLMLSTEKSGIMWQVVILSKAPVYVIEGADTGGRQETSGSRVTLSLTGKL